MKVVAAQIGARRQYGVAASLEKAGILARFYTDLAGNVGLGKLLTAGPLSCLSPFRRLQNRQVPKELLSKTTTFVGPAIRHEARLWLAKLGIGTVNDAMLTFSAELGAAMVKMGLNDCTHVYSMLVECWPLLKAAKRLGLVTVAEVYADLLCNQIGERERETFPDWEPPNKNRFATAKRQLTLSNEDPLFSHTDYFVVPSLPVATRLEQDRGIIADRIRVIPYPVPDSSLLKRQYSPGGRRVLFGGSATLLKGIHHFALASTTLATTTLSFRVAGNVTDRVKTHPEACKLTFLGRLRRSAMIDEMAGSDIFVLPTLSEGSSQVVMEAMAIGLPIITTPSAGAAITDGVDGILVPERDAMALAGAIRRLADDEGLCRELAANAKKTAARFTLDHYSQELARALQQWSQPWKRPATGRN